MPGIWKSAAATKSIEALKVLMIKFGTEQIVTGLIARVQNVVLSAGHPDLVLCEQPEIPRSLSDTLVDNAFHELVILSVSAT